MEVDFETAVQTLVRSGVDQDPHKRVTIGLIVAVLSRKFSHFPERHIAKMVSRAIVAEGGIVDLSVSVKMPTVPMGMRSSLPSAPKSFV